MSPPIPISQLFTPSTRPQWLTTLLNNAAALGLETTSWQSGGQALTIVQLVANMLASGDAFVSGIAQAGFLDYAATGTVSYVTPDGVSVTSPVTPDPSIPAQNPNGQLGWLDALASSVYNVTRIGAMAASGLIAIANASGNTYGPYTAGSYHVANPDTAATYKNVNALTINPGAFVGGGISAASNTTPIQITTNSAHGRSTGDVVFVSGVLGNTAANGFFTITVTSGTQFKLNGSTGSGAYTSGGTVLVCQTATFIADVAGPGGTSGTGQIGQPITSAQGVSVSNLGPFVGAPWESNVDLAARCRAKLQALSPNGPGGAYDFFARSALSLLAAGTLTPSSTPGAPYNMSAPITRVETQSNPVTGVVNVIVANDAGPVGGCANLQVTGASNSTPIAITTTSAHGLSTGQSAIVKGVLGNTNANGTWTTVTVTGPTTFTLDGSVGNGSYAGGGVVDGGDLGGVDAVIQANVVPDSVTASVQSASTWNVAIVATVVVPQSQVAAYTAAAQAAVALFDKSLSIGGTNNGTGGFLPYLDVAGLLWAAGALNGQLSYVVSIPNLTVNGAKVDAAYPTAQSVAVLALTLTVQGV